MTAPRAGLPSSGKEVSPDRAAVTARPGGRHRVARPSSGTAAPESSTPTLEAGDRAGWRLGTRALTPSRFVAVSPSGRRLPLQVLPYAILLESASSPRDDSHGGSPTSQCGTGGPAPEENRRAARNRSKPGHGPNHLEKGDELGVAARAEELEVATALRAPTPGCPIPGRTTRIETVVNYF
jgi:hypothetical protein